MEPLGSAAVDPSANRTSLQEPFMKAATITIHASFLLSLLLFAAVLA